MRFSTVCRAALLLMVPALLALQAAQAQGDPHKVKHIIVIMQENHSFDNYFGALAYAPGSPYHSPGRNGDGNGDGHDGGCRKDDHSCVDGLTCRVDTAGNFQCSNSNLDDDGSMVFAFHDSRRCVSPDLDHGWTSTHLEANFLDPNNSLGKTLSDGFVRVNDVTEQLDKGVENPTEDQTMNFYNQNEIPFYYDLAQKFALNDRYFCSVLGPTFPNRSYLMAATSFGHLTTAEIGPPAGTTGYKPITGTIFDLIDSNKVSWADYFQDFPQGGTFRSVGLVAPPDPHFLPLKLFLAQVTGAPGLPTLPEVSFIDPNFGLLGGFKTENDEHPPTDIQRGQAFVSQVVNAVRNGPFWKDSIILITYDEHGGSYDHVAPPRAPQAHAPNPDGINPGQCADLSNPPASEQPGGGAQCTISQGTAAQLCPGFTVTGPFPGSCANFDQLGFRVPFLAVSPFSKPHYVSHTVGDHTSILALIETIFMTPASQNSQRGDGNDDGEGNLGHPHLTLRDQHANPLLDMFDFNNSPSLNTTIGQAAPPAQDCTPQ